VAGAMTWCTDVAAAYVGGLAVGAPVGLICMWATDSEATLTGTIVVTMLTLLARRRLKRGARATGTIRGVPEPAASHNEM
jgi:hypothetical protein